MKWKRTATAERQWLNYKEVRPDPELLSCWLNRLHAIERNPHAYGWFFSERAYHKSPRLEALGTALHRRLMGNPKLCDFVPKARIVVDSMSDHGAPEFDAFTVYVCDYPKRDHHLMIAHGYYNCLTDQLVMV
jgi:hypothetical protein